jgi:hypothetical protein
VAVEAVVAVAFSWGIGVFASCTPAVGEAAEGEHATSIKQPARHKKKIFLNIRVSLPTGIYYA